MAKTYISKKEQEEKIIDKSIESLADLFIMKLTLEDRHTLAKIKQNEYKQGFLNGMKLRQ